MILDKFGSLIIVCIRYAIQFDIVFREVPFCVRFKEAVLIFCVHIFRDERSSWAIFGYDLYEIMANDSRNM